MTEENIKLFDSELKVMDVLWKDGDVPAKYVADTLNREVGWNKNTTYTLIKIYDGSVDKLFAALLGRKKLSMEQIKNLKQIVSELE